MKFICIMLILSMTYGQEVKLPDTPQGKIVNSFITAFNSGDDENLKNFFKTNVSTEGLSLRSAESRTERMKIFRNEVKYLKVLKVISVKETEIRLSCRGETDQDITLTFQFEPNPPHKFVALQIEMDDTGPEEIGPPMLMDEFQEAVDKYLSAQVKANKFSGTVLVARDTTVLFKKAYGYADKRYSAPNKIETKYNLGSINKFFTRIAIVKLVEQGKLNFNDKIIKYLPDYPDKSIAEKVTIDQLLEMTSGLGDFFGEKFNNTPKNKIRNLHDYLELIKDNKLQFEPGSQRQYSNAGYIVLGLIIEKISGQDYYTYVRENIFLPAGMLNTDSYEMDAVVPDIATGYLHPENNENVWVSNIYTTPARGSSAGGGYSTVEDLFNLIHALKNGKILSPKYSALILTRDFPPREPTLPIKDGYIAIAGGAPGINATLDYDSKIGNTVIVLGNYEPPSAMEVSKKIKSFLRRLVVEKRR